MSEPLPPEASKPEIRDDRATGSWLIVFLVVLAIVGTSLLAPPPADEDEDTRLAMILLQARLLTSVDLVWGWVEASGEEVGARAEEIRRGTAQSLQDVEDLVAGPASARAVAAVHAFVDREDGLARARDLLDRYDPPAEDETEVRLHGAVRAALDDPGSLAPEDRRLVRERMGWFGDLLLARALPFDDPDRRAVVAARPLVAAIGFFLLVILGLLGGLILLVVGLVLLGSGKLRLRMTPGVGGGAVYVQAFAVYLALWFLLQVGPAVLGLGSAAVGLVGLVLASAAGVFWPVLRGVPGGEAARALGFHRGSGWIREIGAGVVGYLAMLPIVAVGLLMTLVLVFFSEVLGFGGDEGQTFVGHPILVWIAEGGPGVRFGLFFLAAVFAPFFEEAMFRGALLRGLRARFGPIFSGMAVAFIFAVIHPQGILAVPALMSLGFGFALLREWRDSLIAPMVGHAINNGAIVGLMWLVLG